MFNIIKKKNKEKDKIQDKEDEQEQAAQSTEEQFSEKEVKIDENVTIYTMPERFRFSHGQASHKKTGLVIIVFGLIFLMVLAAGAYYYFYMMEPAQPSGTPEATSTPETTQPTQPSQPGPQPQPQPEPQPTKSAKATFLEMKNDFDKINTFINYEQTIRKYGSKNRITQLEQEKKQYSSLTGSAQDDFVNSLINATAKSKAIEEINEKVIDSTATLNITIEETEEQAIVKMVAEQGQWKLASQIWPETTGASSGPANGFIAGVDSDRDGLTNKEEALLGTDINNTDSDNDNYSDLSEALNLYNPAGNDRLINNPNISKYLNNSYNYNMLYPTNWSPQTVGGDESVMFKSTDNHFINVITETNENREPIINWYKKQFEVTTINNTKLVTPSDRSWQGIKSEDNLTIYLTDQRYNNIITITYISGQDIVLDYINILEIVIKSFTISE